jgi:hypothetical protein
MHGSIGARRMRALLVALIGAVMMSLSLSVAGTASAAPVVPTQTVVSQMLPMATTPLSSHCGTKARWKLDLKTQDSKLKFRVWHYTNSAKTRNFCVKIYKVKPKHNKTTIGLYVESYKGNLWHATTKSSSLWVKVKVPKGKTAYFAAHYGSTSYQWLALNGYGT